MHRSGRHGCWGLVGGLLLLLLAGCGDSGDRHAADAVALEPARQAPRPSIDAREGADAGDAAGGMQNAAARIEERRSYMLQFDATEPLVDSYRAVHDACETADACRVEQGRLQTPRQGHAHAHLALRIERSALADAAPLMLILESPALSGSEITRTDRSRQVIDLQARLTQQQILRERLQELAREGAGGEHRIQDLLQVERELARVQGEIESMQGQQRHLQEVTDTVAVAVDFQQQRWTEPGQQGVLAPLWRALDRSLGLFFESVGQVILVVVFLTPWLVIGIPVLWLLTRLWRPLRRGLSGLFRRDARASASETRPD